MNQNCQVIADIKASNSLHKKCKLLTNVDTNSTFQNEKRLAVLLNNRIEGNLFPDSNFFGKIKHITRNTYTLELIEVITGDFLNREITIERRSIIDYLYEEDFLSEQTFLDEVKYFNQKYRHEKLSELISRRLRELDMSKSDLARKMNVSRTYITDLANGTAKTPTGEYNPSPSVIESLSQYLQIEESKILRAIGYDTSPNPLPLQIAVIDFSIFNQTEINDIAEYIQFKKAKKEEKDREPQAFIDVSRRQQIPILREGAGAEDRKKQ